MFLDQTYQSLKKPFEFELSANISTAGESLLRPQILTVHGLGLKLDRCYISRPYSKGVNSS